MNMIAMIEKTRHRMQNDMSQVWGLGFGFSVYPSLPLSARRARTQSHVRPANTAHAQLCCRHVRKERQLKTRSCGFLSKLPVASSMASPPHSVPPYRMYWSCAHSRLAIVYRMGTHRCSLRCGPCCRNHSPPPTNRVLARHLLLRAGRPGRNEKLRHPPAVP
jgi:hypothetical protein